MITFLVVSVYVSAAQSAILSTARITASPVLHPRQESTTQLQEWRDLGYFSVGQEYDTTVYKIGQYAAYASGSSEFPIYIASSSSFYDACVFDSDLLTSTCTYYTACSSGTLFADDFTATTCGDSSICFTDILYSKWPPSTDGQTSYFCDVTNSFLITGTSFFVEQPPSTGTPWSSLPASTVASTTSSVPTSSASSSFSSSTFARTSSGTSAASTSTAPTPDPPPKNDNTKVVAGSAVSGVLGLAIVALAVWYTIRRRRGHTVPSGGAMSHAPMAPNEDMPEWVNPNTVRHDLPSRAA